MNKIKVALVGIGNCASSLVQGRYYYDGRKAPAFVAMADFITSIFLARGVLHGAVAPPPKESP